MSTKKNGEILLVDDDSEMRSMLHDFLASRNYAVHSFASPSEAFAFVQTSEAQNLDLIISDLRMPDMDGMEFIARAAKVLPDVPSIVITAFGTIEAAIESTRAGVFDFIVKPFELKKISISVERAVRFSGLKKENIDLKEQIKAKPKVNLIGKSKEMQRVFELVERVSKANANVLVTGESGTGKEMVARSIHKNGNRKEQPFVAINCTAIPDTLMESELFGHAKGSFTGAINNKKGLFEEANGGTLFLDEIGDLDLSLQAKLLRAIQEKKIKPVGENKDIDIDVRIIAATHKDLKLAIKEGTFREDLFYRLCVIPVAIPPLRHRKDDIPALVHFFLDKYCKENGVETKAVHPLALHKLMENPWEGNVRELENLIERLVVLVESSEIKEQDIPTNESKSTEDFIAGASQDLPSLQEIEKRYIRLVLDKVGGRKDKAANVLGINRRTLYRKEREYGFVVDISDGPEMAEN